MAARQGALAADRPPAGLALVDKPAGPTSHDCVARVRRWAGTKKIGHAGTLDPAATGLLILGVGRATRLLTYLVGLDKVYTATIRLGAATTTDDSAGERLFSSSAAGLDLADVRAAMSTWRGPVAQVPSAVSAVKVGGQRAYARVRAGQEVVLKPRPVVIRRFDLLASRVEGPHLDLDVVVECSSGTYVRALARDLGAGLGVGGHLTALRRLRIGPFDVAEAQPLPARDLLSGDPPAGGSGAPGVPRLAVETMASAARRLWPTRLLDPEEVRRLSHGQSITPNPGLGALGALEGRAGSRTAGGSGRDPGDGTQGGAGSRTAGGSGRDPGDGTQGGAGSRADGIGGLVAAIGPDGELVALIEGGRPVAVFA
ncbi:MAG: tRNA pseudouridine(55) synthase TruB [Bifidobacteriaceae bacterium]|jgi:tRNA pseudouridine55 synthase|nr:tRNA pseudouridine(55) synthase TruB [Bifidobacteriaceae bacterium]